MAKDKRFQYIELDRRGAGLLFQVLTEREVKNSAAAGRLCARTAAASATSRRQGSQIACHITMP